MRDTDRQTGSSDGGERQSRQNNLSVLLSFSFPPFLPFLSLFRFLYSFFFISFTISQFTSFFPLFFIVLTQLFCRFFQSLQAATVSSHELLQAVLIHRCHCHFGSFVVLFTISLTSERRRQHEKH